MKETHVVPFSGGPHSVAQIIKATQLRSDCIPHALYISNLFQVSRGEQNAVELLIRTMTCQGEPLCEMEQYDSASQTSETLQESCAFLLFFFDFC